MSPRDKQTVPIHRIVSVTWIDARHARERLRNAAWCEACQKLTFYTVDDAHSYIGLILWRQRRTGEEPRRYRSYLRPYECRHGNGFHVGRDSKVAQLFEARQKRSAA